MKVESPLKKHHRKRWTTFSRGVPSALSFSFFRMKSGSCSTFFWCSFRWLLHQGEVDVEQKNRNIETTKKKKQPSTNPPLVVAEGKLGVKSPVAEFAAIFLQQLQHLLDQHLVSGRHSFQRIRGRLPKLGSHRIHNLHRSLFTWMNNSKHAFLVWETFSI